MRSNAVTYQALERAAQDAAQALAHPDVAQALAKGDTAAKALGAQVLAAYQQLAHTQAAPAALQWAEKLLGNAKTPEGKARYDAIAGNDPAFLAVLSTTVIEPSLPNVAKTYFEDNGGDAQAAAHRMSLHTTASMAAIRWSVLIADTANMVKASTASPDAVTRLGAGYQGTSPVLKVLWGPGSAFGLYRAVLEIYEGRYVNGARYGALSGAGVVTFGVAAAEAAQKKPTASAWQKKAAEKILEGPAGTALKKVASWSPGLGAVGSAFSLVEHTNRPTSVGNNVSLVGDVAAVAGASSLLAANVTSNEARALTLSRVGMTGWYGAALIVGGELYEVGRQLRLRSAELSPDDHFEGLKHLLHLKKSVIPGVD